MRELQTYFVLTFATTTAAMAMERICKEKALPGRLIPVPGGIRSGCGMCWRAPLAARQVLEALVVAEKLSVDGLYEYKM